MSIGKVSIVVPCYNEERRLQPDKFLSFLSSNERAERINFIFVNDGSRDRTETVLQELAAANPERLQVLSLNQNSGKAAAVRAGLRFAVSGESSEAIKLISPAAVDVDYDPPASVGFWDADLATPLEAIPSFIEILSMNSSISLVMGARVKLLGRNIERLALRHYLGRGSATLISLTLGIPVYDTQCGAKLFRMSDELRAIIDEPFISRFLFDVELIARMIEYRKSHALSDVTESIYELPLLTWRDVKGSKVAPSDYGRGLRDLWAIYRRYAGSL